MSLNPDRRRHPRIDSKIEVQFQSGDEFIHTYTKNISQGGIYLESETLPDPNAKIELILDFSETVKDLSQNKVSLFGRVVRLITVSEGGKTIHKIGVQFVDISPQVQLRLDQVVKALQTKS